MKMRKTQICAKNYFLCTKKISVLFLSLLFSFTMMAQNITVSGVVKDDLGDPIAGVSVQDINKVGGAITDGNGKYEIPVPGDATLSFGSIGFKTQKVKVNGRTTINITMSEDIGLLDEVVVIGYGVQKRSDLTGSVTSVKAEDINKFPAANVAELLRGQAPGISVSLGSAAPGGSSNVLVRGKRSLSGSQNPLYIVDGMIVPNIDDINAQDIASIEILKDASSQAIYGSRASNGVILVSTKRGKAGKVTINLNSDVSVHKAHRNFDMYSPDEWLALRYWGMGGTTKPDLLNEDGSYNLTKVLKVGDWIRNYEEGNFTDWEDLTLGSAVMHKHDISIRGGSEQLRFASSFGYLNQDGVVKGSGYQRGNFRTNVDYAPYKWMDMGVSMAFTRSDTKTADGSYYRAITSPSFASPYTYLGEGVVSTELQRDLGENNLNPLWQNREATDKKKNDFLNLGAFVTIKPLEGLSYKFSANLRTNDRESGKYYTGKYSGRSREGSILNFKQAGYLIENVVNYVVPFANKDMHNLQVTLIQAVEQDKKTNTGFDFNNSPSDQFGWNMAGDAEVTKVTRDITQTRSVSFAARAQYSLMGRYLLTASIRRDGASVFGEDHKWANFPSVALAWRMNDESFMKGIEWIDMLKPRISYGIVGSWGVDPYLTMGIAYPKEYILNGGLAVGYLPGVGPGSTQEEINKWAGLRNPKLKWETTSSLNFGLDFSGFKGRLNASFEYYITSTKDLLIKRSLSAITGLPHMWTNLGKTESKGFEMALNGSVIRNSVLEWNVGFSLSTQKRTLKKIDGRVDANGKPINDTANNWFIGEDPNVIRQYVIAGIWQTGEEATVDQYPVGDKKPIAGDIKLFDYDGDGKISEADKKLFNKDPRWYATINTSLLYKGFDIAAEFYTVQDVWKHNKFLEDFDFGGGLNGVKNGIKQDYWTVENPTNAAPRPQQGSGMVPYMGALGTQKANYFRLRTATIGYTIPQALTRKAMIEKARFYVTGANIFTSTKYKSYSPEKEASDYPETRSISFGVNLTF